MLQLSDSGTSWPALGMVTTGTKQTPVALHVGPIGLSHRGRDAVERRFQNPGQGKPVVHPPGRLPLLLGLWEEGERPVVVAMDASHRIDKETRQSLFIPLAMLLQASKEGWAEHYSSTGELLVAFHPALLSAYLEMAEHAAILPAEEVTTVLDAAGFNDAGPATPEERARRTTTQLVRSAVFRTNVRKSYDDLCAMCGFNFSLVTGAHIYPASAPYSPDEAWNGLALCHNHHAAFDSHRIWVDPGSRAVKFHPHILGNASKNAASNSFVETTFAVLREPMVSAARPRAEMFEQRYDYYVQKYEWA